MMRMRTWCLILSLLLLCGTNRSNAQMVTGRRMADYDKTFGLTKEKLAYQAILFETNAEGNIFHPHEEPRFQFQIQNHTNETITVQGKVDVMAYGTKGIPGNIWKPRVFKIADIESISIGVNLPGKGWQDFTIQPKIPQRLGGYALVVDLGAFGRQFLTGMVRTFKPSHKRIQYPKQSLEFMSPAILQRMNISALRYGVPYHLPDTQQRGRIAERLERDFKAMHAHNVTALVEIGTGHQGQPLGRGRPHLDDQGRLKGGKEDLVWLPEHDDDYQQFVYDIACKYGWPKGPVTGFMLWNEPWEGLSISGWGADMIRYRTLYKRMGDAIFRARKDAGVDVLIGGCDSSTNTWDKLFPDGSDEFIPYLDFCSIHYQGLSSPSLYPQWNQRKHHKGRVLVWDTESWVANTDDRFSAVVAANRAAGYDRAMGIYGGNVTTVLSHHRVAHDTIHTPDGPKRIERLIMAWPVAASIGASQHFIGERDFQEVLFEKGLPWVFVFKGLDGKPEDGTVVVVGDIGSLFTKGGALYQNVRSLDEIHAKDAIREQLTSLPADQRKTLRRKLQSPMPFTGASMTLKADDETYRLYDFYGNAMNSEKGKIVIPLDNRGFFLRAQPDKSGSFQALLQAIRDAYVKGFESLEIVAHDFLEPIDRQPTLRLQLTNMFNRRVKGALKIQIEGLRVQSPQHLSLAAHEQKTLLLPVRGKATPDNEYPISIRFNAGRDGWAVHEETLHVNWISRKTVTVDGNLDDWRGALPQIIRTDREGERSFQEQMWLPFESYSSGLSGGLATAYLAYDDKYFYFAAKVADDSPHPGTIRYADRDPDAAFYPKESFDRNGKILRWPEGVRRFSYRRWPDLPFGSGSRAFDNILIAFNAIPMEEDAWQVKLPERPHRFIWYKCTDYEFALNPVANTYGGGTEMWKLQVPGMPRKHFFPRQPKHPLEGAVEDSQLRIVHEGNTRVTEAAIPWSAIPHVKQRMERGETIKFSYRVNHNNGGPIMELAYQRSVSKINSQAFHAEWQEHWANELAFRFEP